MIKQMHILGVFSEVFPYSKTGGLGDVGKSLPKAIEQYGHRVYIITPLYGTIDKNHYKLNLVLENRELVIDESKKTVFNCYRGTTDDGVPVFFIDNPEFFGQYTTIYGAPNNNARFLFFDLAVLEIIKAFSLELDIVHCNDWHTGLIPYFARTRYKNDDLISKISFVFTIHNLAFQLEKNWWEVSNGEKDDGRSHLPLFNEAGKISNINFLKRAIIHSDAINTVSGTYAKEILTKQFGEDLHVILRNHKEKLYGILNGIDYDDYNPQTDPGLWANYNEKTFDHKKTNKINLQKKFNLPVDENIPLLIMVTRITKQKGFDLFFEIADELLGKNVQVFILGEGDKKYEAKIKNLVLKYHEKIAANLEFDITHTTRVYAGGDIFLMPSLYEPCGLVQMISLRYGVIPVVRAVGGLVDTIVNYNQKKKRGNGFVFKNYNKLEFLEAVNRALDLYQNRGEWERLAKFGMGQSFSWEIPAKKYLKLFRKAKKIHKHQ